MPSEERIIVGNDGQLYSVGSAGLAVMDPRIYIGDALVLCSSAIDHWNDSVTVARVLLSQRSLTDHLQEVILCNQTLVVLVTGFEGYCALRFVELEAEGITPHLFFRPLLTKEEMDAHNQGRELEIEQNARNRGVLLSKELIDRHNPFQNYERAKDVFRTAYGLSFGTLDVGPTVLADVNRIIGYRNVVVHVSPLIGLLNSEKLSDETPVFSGDILANTAIARFSEFVERLHAATLQLRPGRVP
jgi:hypothetical protein